MRATHAAVGGIDTLVKKVAKSADASKVAEAKGTLSAQEEALKATWAKQQQLRLMEATLDKAEAA